MSAFIDTEVMRLLPEPDKAEVARLQLAIDDYINSPDSPAAEVFDLVRRACAAFNERNKDNENIAQINLDKLDANWHLGNLRSATRASAASLEKVFGSISTEPLTQDYFKPALEKLTDLVDEKREKEDEAVEAVDYIKENFTNYDRDIAGMLRDGGFLPRLPVLTSSLLRRV